MKEPIEAIVRKCEHAENDLDIYFLELELENIENLIVSPGQFVFLVLQNKQDIMPRPFSVVAVNGSFLTVVISAGEEKDNAYLDLLVGEIIEVVEI